MNLLVSSCGHFYFEVVRRGHLECVAVMLKIHGFDFYSNPKFTMLLTLNDFADVHFLDKEENRCSNVPTIKASVSDRPLPLYLVLAVAFGSLTVMIGMRRYFSKKVLQSAWSQP